MEKREREKSLKKLFKDYGLSKKIVAEGINIKHNSFNVYMSTSLPRKFEEKIINFLENFAKKLLKDVKKL